MWPIVVVLVVVLLLVAVLSNKRYKWFYILRKTFKRDIRGLKIMRFATKRVKYMKKHDITVHKAFQSILEKYPNKAALLFEDEAWTYTQLEDFSNKIGHYFNQKGYVPGDVVGLFYESRPEFVCIWLGLTKVGVVTALINTNLVRDSLVHSLKIGKCRALIYGASYAPIVGTILNDVGHLRLYEFDDTFISAAVLRNSINLKHALENISNNALEIRRDINYNDDLLYIYTSGTTGLPKAAVMTHMRYLAFVSTASYIFTPSDTLYDPLPLYHTVGFVGIGLSVIAGVTVVIKKKFSASQYWDDCVKYQCTRAQYVGEMCRYILSTSMGEPPHHKVMKIFGNGLKSDIWVEYVKRFKIKDVLEYYASTEGICTLFNIDNKVGSVGFIPRYMRKSHYIQLIKFNEETEEPIRIANGQCVRCEIGEQGLVIGKIDRSHAMHNFRGYCDEEETHKKILSNVFTTGDQYFNSGDVMVFDELGYLYFKDRLGDTFRWKGENVSTFEVETILSKILGNTDVLVFGVQIPGTDGKAGMAVIADPENCLNLHLLSEEIHKFLPKYAIPLFVRVTKGLPLTSTFKMQKGQLRSEGANVNIIKDSVYFYDTKLKQYLALTLELYENIVSNKVRI